MISGPNGSPWRHGLAKEEEKRRIIRSIIGRKSDYPSRKSDKMYGESTQECTKTSSSRGPCSFFEFKTI